LASPVYRVKIDTILWIAQTRIQLIKSRMALYTESRISFSIIVTIFWYASTIDKDQPNLTLYTNVSIVAGTALNLSYTLFVRIEFISDSTSNTNVLGVELFAS
jgi:hypothetical protein